MKPQDLTRVLDDLRMSAHEFVKEKGQAKAWEVIHSWDKSSPTHNLYGFSVYELMDALCSHATVATNGRLEKVISDVESCT